MRTFLLLAALSACMAVSPLPAPGQMVASASPLLQKAEKKNTGADSGARSLKEVLQEFKKHYAIDILFFNSMVEGVEIPAKDIRMEEDPEKSLRTLLQNSGLTYKKSKNGGYVIVARKKREDAVPGQRSEKSINRFPESREINLERQVLPVTELLRQKVTDRTVAGRVADEKGELLPGVSILLKGTQQGTTTDGEGRFSLNVPDENAVLVFSFVGYVSQEVAVGNRSLVEVSLEVDEKSLEEIVVVGYGTQKKVNLTGAVDVITSEQITNRQLSNVTQILQGLSPALNFSAGDQGLGPGASLGVNIRGIGSLNGGSPLIIIDGFPGTIDYLNPNDIESISILKDAAASAIYGARAPYGVILITTKGGRKNEMFSVTYSGNVSFNTPDRLPAMLDSYTYARVVNEMGDNGGGRTYDNSAIDRIVAYQNQDWDYLAQFMPPGVTHFEVIPRPENPNRWGNSLYGNANYDWYDEFYGHSFNQNHNISLTGGSEKSSYFISGGYVGQNGVVNYGTDYFKRFNLTAKISTQITKWWELNYETRFSRQVREHFTGTGISGDYSNFFSSVFSMNPTYNKYFGFGEYSMDSRIPMLRNSGNDKYLNNENWQILRTKVGLLKGWNISGDFAFKSFGLESSSASLTLYEPLIDGSLLARGETIPSQIEKIQGNDSYWSANIFTSYDFAFSGKHNFNILAGSQLESDKSNRLNSTRTNLMVDNVISLRTANGEITSSETLGQWATLGYFGRFSYNFNEKYLLEANARYDGTSRFQMGKRWGFFPSFSAGWNIDREEFWKRVEPYISTLKIRGSWGRLGNQQVTPYLDLPLIPLQTGRLDWIFSHGQTRPIGYTTSPNMVSRNLTWETATTLNLGLNASFFGRKMILDFDWFDRTTTNMIGPAEPVPGVLGTTVPQSNNATLQTRGWEATVGWSQVFPSKDMSFLLKVNIQDARSKVLSYLNPSGIVTDWYTGKNVGEIWGFTVNKLYQSQEELDAYLEKTDLSSIHRSWNVGDVKYEDINGDGKVDRGANSLDDHGDLKIIGNNTPRFQFGLNGGFNLKKLDFSFLVRGTAKRHFAVRENASQTMFWGVTQLYATALTEQHLDYFRDRPGDRTSGLYTGDANINTDAYWPRPYMNAALNAKNRQTSTRYLLNAAYLRLQNVQFGYSFPIKISQKFKLQKTRIYLSGENLLTLTKLLKGIDPLALETNGRIGMIYGSDKMYSLGLNVTF